MAWCHYLTEHKDTPDAGWLSPLLSAVPKENQEVQALLVLTDTWCSWRHFPDTWSFPPSAPSQDTFGSHFFSHPCWTSHGPPWSYRTPEMSPVVRRQVRDARGRTTGWVCAIPQRLAGCGDGREKERMGKEPPLHLNWQCLAGTQPHQSQPLLQINRAEMY